MKRLLHHVRAFLGIGNRTRDLPDPMIDEKVVPLVVVKRRRKTVAKKTGSRKKK